ncbi:response regulator [Paenibacillus sp. FSL H8-0548]|uniref:response regulator n=1 Tax=Paenibacillus sp. FSL H8-0548 TaxID=1920422 RepID=UPI0009F836C9|nr:response regulator [Paenibacillus sp. FSL H8-0548]
MIFFYILIAAALLIALLFVLYYQRTVKKAQQLSDAHAPIVPTSTLSTQRIMTRTRKNASESSSTNYQSVREKNYTILVVDDNTSLRSMLNELFTSLGFNVFEAANGAQALELFQQEMPNCVLLDLKMPDRDGIEILRDLRELSQAVPVILITGYADPAQLEEAEKLGISDCFMKPFDIIELQEEVIHLVEPKPILVQA